MKTFLRVTAVLALVLVAALVSRPGGRVNLPATAAAARLPLRFEPNQGQSDPEVKFLVRGPGQTLFLTAQEVVLRLHRPTHPTALRMRLLGANPAPRLEGLDPLPGQSHYLIGNDPGRWRTHIAHYGRVRYREVYPGVDLIYYGSQGRLEYDFVVGPKADPGAIRLAFEGAESMSVDATGDLVLRRAPGEIRQHRPRVYQEAEGARREISGRYLVQGNEVAFQLAGYDAGRVLVIDPVLSYSTYLGGSGGDEALAIAVSPSGNSYVAGIAGSASFPGAAEVARSISRGGASDAFVAKLTPAGSLVWVTYLGGGGSDEGWAVQVDASENVWVAGRTNSSNFPVTATAFQRSYRGAWDAFLARLDPSGASLLYSTYLGDTGDDEAWGLAVSDSGEAYIVGRTSSPGFPTTPKAPQKDSGGGHDAFVTKLDRAGGLAYSTYLGGSLWEWAQDVAVDQEGNAIVTGTTSSNDFPTKNALQPANPGDVAYKTTDAAASWTPVRLGGRLYANVWVIDPADSWNVYGGTTAGVFRTTDGGANWNPASRGLTNLNVMALAIDPRNPSTLYAGTNGGGVFKSTDRGSNWSPASNGLTNLSVWALDVDPANPSQIYAGTWGAGVFKSVDGGGRWNPASTGLTPIHIRCIAVDPKTPSTVYAGTLDGGIFKSTSGGNSWNAINIGLGGLDVLRIAIDPTDPSILYVAVDKGYKSTDGGASWVALGSGFSSGCYAYGVAIDPRNPSTVYATSNCGLFKSSDGGNSWKNSSSGIASSYTQFVAIDPSNPSVLYVTGPPGAEVFVAKLNASGTGLVYSTYLGGSSTDEGWGVALDMLGNAYVAGRTFSPGFPVTSSAGQLAVGKQAAFVAKLNPGGSAVLYSILVGTEGWAEGRDIVVRPTGEAILAGRAGGRLPTSPGAVQRTLRGPADAFVAVLNPAGNQLSYCSYLGGSKDDGGQGVGVDAYGNIYLAGRTPSTDFPTANAWQAANAGDVDAFIARISEALEPLELMLTTPAFLPAGLAGASYWQALSALGGKPPYRWVVELGGLPPGLRLDPSTGVISGTPTTPGSYGFAVRLTDSAQTSAWRSFTLTVNAPASLTITSASPLPDGAVGIGYSQDLVAAGGTPPYRFEIAGGSLPPGLQLNATTGRISGQPTSTGTFLFKVRVTDSAGGVHAKDFSITITPPVTVAAVVNGASLSSGPVAPGEIVTLFGTGMGPGTLTPLQLNESGQVATTLAEVQVTFDNIPAPLLYVQANQLSAIVPYAVAGTTEAKMQVQYRGAGSDPMSVRVAASAPGLFTIDSSGRGQGAILNQNYSVNSAANPAEKGSVVILYGTGEGVTDPQVADGRLVSVSELPKPKLPVTVKIGGLDAEVLYAGGAPGSVAGLLQVNVRVPPGVASGNAVPVVLTVGSASSQPGVAMAVK